MKHLLILAAFFMGVNAYAQDYTVTGNIVDTNNAAVAYSNVLLLNVQDSTLVKGTVTEENGRYSIESLVKGTYLLIASFVGFADGYSEPFDLQGDLEMPAIVLNEDLESLDEINISFRKPTIDKKIDRLVFNVENTVVSSGSSYDILKQTPGVIISQGKILVKRSDAEVYINDRKVYLSSRELQELLEGLSGANIKSVEVITNPPSKYDAEGGAILNIVTSKSISVGYKGSVNASNTVAVVPKYTAGTSHYYKNNWLNVFTNYNFSSRYAYKHDEAEIVYYNPQGNIDSNWDDDFKRNTHSLTHSLNTILDFQLNEKNSLSFSANILHMPKSDSDIDGRTEIYNTQNQLDSLYTTDSNRENKQDNILLNLTYSKDLGENGANLSAIANYIKYDDDQFQDLQTLYFSPQGGILNDNSFNTDAHQDSDIFTAQIDLSAPISDWAFESGLKYTGSESESRLNFFDTNSGSPEFIAPLSDSFNYNEDIFATYISFSRDWEKWSIKGGLRGEYTDIEGNSLALGEVNTQEYFELFPTFFLMYNPQENHSFGLTYNRGISRPHFQSLNPYRTYLNENNFNLGNPDLQPGFSNRLELNYSFKNKLFFSAYWDRTDDKPLILPFQDNENRILRSVTDNVLFEQQYSFDIAFTDYIKDWWSLYAETSFFNMQTEFIGLESNNQTIQKEVTGIYLGVYNSFTLSKDGTFSADVSSYFFDGFITGSYEYDDPQFHLTIGLRKTFFNDRLVATVDATDIFNTLNIPLSSRYLNQNNSFFAMPESRTVRFGLRYNLGNFKLSDNQRPTDAEESERLKEQSIMD